MIKDMGLPTGNRSVLNRETKEQRYAKVLDMYNKDYSLSSMVDKSGYSFGEIGRIIKEIEKRGDGDTEIKEVDYVGR
jgi:hypothetical protein